MRCYRKSLHELLKLHPEWKDRNGLTQMKLRKITAGARAAIRMHSATMDAEALRRDLRNGPYVFGDHRKCSASFCKIKQAEKVADCEVIFNTNKESSNDSTNLASGAKMDNEILEIFPELEDEREDDKKAAENEAVARVGGIEYMLDKLLEGLFCQIQKCGDRIVSLSQQLIENCTSNAAENFMAVNTKFNGGKQINQMQKGSFEHRCHGAALSFQKGAGWHASMWQRFTEQPAGPVLNKYCPVFI